MMPGTKLSRTIAQLAGPTLIATTASIVGWLALLGGLFRMLAPEARQGGPNIATFALLAVLFAPAAF
jgi:hypothetical protein